MDRPSLVFGVLSSLLIEQLFHFIHHAVHLFDGQFQGFIGSHVDSGVFQQVDGVFRFPGRNEFQIALGRVGISRENFFRQR